LGGSTINFGNFAKDLGSVWTSCFFRQNKERNQLLKF
jgi:hypothetical protein